MQKRTLNRRYLKIFVLVSFFCALFVFAFSFVAHIITPGKLIPASFSGGCLGILLAHYFLLKKGLISKSSWLPVLVCSLIAFGVSSFIIVFNFNNPLIILLCFLIACVSPVLSEIYFEGHRMLADNKILAFLGLLLLMPGFYFTVSSLLKFQFGIDFLFNPVDYLLEKPHGQMNFNAITPFIFGGGLFLAFSINTFALIKNVISSHHTFNSRLPGIKIIPTNLLVVLISFITGCLLLGYLFLENLQLH